MTDDTAPAWPDSARPGVPLNAEKDGWHWVTSSDGQTFPAEWRAAGECERGRWAAGWIYGENDHDPATCAYIAPCLTPSDQSAREAAAVADTWEVATHFLNVIAEPDDRLCCDGRECCCQGATKHQEAEHYMRVQSPAFADAVNRLIEREAAVASAGGAREVRNRALKIADDAIPTAHPPQTDHYGAHVAGERHAAERIVQRIRALPIPDTAALDRLLAEAREAAMRELLHHFALHEYPASFVATAKDIIAWMDKQGIETGVRWGGIGGYVPATAKGAPT